MTTIPKRAAGAPHDPLPRLIETTGLRQVDLARLLGRTEPSVSKAMRSIRAGGGRDAAGPLDLAAAVLLECDEATRERIEARLRELREARPDRKRAARPASS